MKMRYMTRAIFRAIIKRYYPEWKMFVTDEQYNLWKMGVRDARIHDTTCSILGSAYWRDNYPMVG